MTSLSWACLDTPVGMVCAGCTAAGVAQVRYGAPPTTRAQHLAGGAADADPAADALAAAARRELTEYFRGDRQVFDVPVDWTAVAGLHRQVLTVLAGSVGYGHTINYGGLARAAGLTDADQDGTLRVERGQPPAGLAARTVGTIMATNPVPVVVPCHRVVASDGLGGYSGGAGIETKRWLLILEGSLPPTLDWQPMPRPA